MKKEIRVYGINVELYDSDDNYDTGFHSSWSDEKFIQEAEIQGNVWSLNGFQEAFNNDDINQYVLMIRII